MVPIWDQPLVSLWLSGCLARGERPALTSRLSGTEADKVYCRFLHVYRIRGTPVPDVNKIGTTKNRAPSGAENVAFPTKFSICFDFSGILAEFLLCFHM